MSTRPVSKLKTVVVAASLLLMTALFVLIFVLRLTQSPDTDVQLGNKTFEVNAERLAPEIKKRGPLLLQDPLGRGRHVYLQHIGDDPAQGWVALGAVAPGQPERCAVTWKHERKVFEDPCTKAVYPAEGGGLTRYATEVKPQKKDKHTVVVDLRTTPSN